MDFFMLYLFAPLMLEVDSYCCWNFYGGKGNQITLKQLVWNICLTAVSEMRFSFLQVLQRRTIGKLDFLKRWRQYIAGFGNVTEEFWIGEQSNVLSVLMHIWSNRVLPLAFTFSVWLSPQVWIRYMSLPTLLLGMSWGLTWAWAQREPMPCMMTSRLRQSSRSSNSLLANTVAQQVGLLLLKSFQNYQQNKNLTLRRQHEQLTDRGGDSGFFSSSWHPTHHSVGCWKSKYTATVGGIFFL